MRRGGGERLAADVVQRAHVRDRGLRIGPPRRPRARSPRRGRDRRACARTGCTRSPGTRGREDRRCRCTPRRGPAGARRPPRRRWCARCGRRRRRCGGRRVFALPVPPGQSLVHDDRALAALAVPVLEGAAAQHGHAQRFEVGRAHPDERALGRRARDLAPALDGEGPVVAELVVEGERPGRAHRHDARALADLILHRTVEGFDLVRVDPALARRRRCVKFRFTRAESTRSPWKPASTWRRFWKLRRVRDAPIRRTKDKASCQATRPVAHPMLAPVARAAAALRDQRLRDPLPAGQTGQGSGQDSGQH